MNGLSRPTAVLFDWDNTLVDSWAVIHAALNETFVAMGHPSWTRAETEARVRGSLRDTFPAMFGDRWQEAEKIFYDAFGRLHLESLTPLPGAAALLSQLAEAELEAVLAHEIGHYKRRHIPKMLAGSALGLLLAFFVPGATAG